MSIDYAPITPITPITQQNSALGETDLSLIQRVQGRDTDALSELYDRHSTKVYSVALFLTHNTSWAEEATQEAFLRLWTGAEPYQHPPGDFSVWLIVITRRCAINILSREFRKTQPIALTQNKINPLSNIYAEEQIRYFEHGPSLDRITTTQLDISHDTIKDFARLKLAKLLQVFHKPSL